MVTTRSRHAEAMTTEPRRRAPIRGGCTTGARAPELGGTRQPLLEPGARRLELRRDPPRRRPGLPAEEPGGARRAPPRVLARRAAPSRELPRAAGRRSTGTRSTTTPWSCSGPRGSTTSASLRATRTATTSPSAPRRRGGTCSPGCPSGGSCLTRWSPRRTRPWAARCPPTASPGARPSRAARASTSGASR